MLRPANLQEATIFIIRPTIDGTTGNDRISGTSAAELIIGDAGDDIIAGNAGDDELLGNRGRDFLLGGAGSDILRGGQDSDVLYGGRGNDTLYGDQGADILNGDFGADNLYGGTGGDKFYFDVRTAGFDGLGGAGVDTIHDFGGGDTLQFGGFGSDARLVLTQSGANTVVAIDLDGNGSADYTLVTVLNATKASVQAASSFGDLIL